MQITPSHTRRRAAICRGWAHNCGMRGKSLGPNPLGGPLGTHPHTVSGSITVVPSALPDIGLLMQTVVELGEKTDEGRIVLAVTLPWFDIIRALEKDPAMAFQMTPRQWEEMVAGAYDRGGADEVILTPRSGDLGRDVIAIFRGIGTVRVIDQVKAYKPGHLVTAEHVRALLGVLDADGASKGFLTTTSDFAPKLRDDRLLKPYIGRQLDLIDGKQLLASLVDLSKK
jgi:restriction system protein